MSVKQSVKQRPSRERRAIKSRKKLAELCVVRLSVHRTPRHIYAQVIDTNGNVLAAASTLDKELREVKLNKIQLAEKVGALIASRATAKGVSKVGFDRSGFRYHGRIKALADAARSGGLEY